MKLKNILLISTILVVLTMSAASATDNNMTTDIVELENDQIDDEISIEENDSDLSTQNIISNVR